MTKVAVFGGGCFWCTEAVFKMLKGVVSVAPGYAGSPQTASSQAPTYKEVSSGKTGHAEVTRIEYDPAKISFRELLIIFFATHDPTTLNRQGNDVGTQYRSIILYTTPNEKEEAEVFIREIEESSAEGGRVVTEVQPLTKFYEAENYHRDYFAKNPSEAYCRLVISPKIEKVQKEFAELLKKNG
ncbi:peptide-methionine (S)-S-oxide reductase [Candidatus Giovannonibacteria bacterium RIFCSPHIGHO2_02_FULL_44_31]|nr:MAG: peptide-methionine (S)-S-oxide reductase [Candidatus Giovannonibacteria bacterium RIFCSPHIGHO2_02_FULL_44_31]OGF77108.1 MAG: peptide-methionine (S)-S-oxide reductase [Candidatus Giovannonibacteria bacterium RIFCSPHIGHO2_12_FULL_44_29]